MRVLIIADDLTGALDSAVALTGSGLRCILARRPEDVPAALRRDPDVLAINTASREGTEEAARASVARALAETMEAVSGADPPVILFKKIDSRLKGHVAAEAAAMGQAGGLRRALVAPAVPAQRRLVVGGRLVGPGVPEPLPVAEAAHGTSPALLVPDTRNDAELDTALARAMADAPETLLLVGAAGLAAALARRLAPGSAAATVRRLGGPVLLAIGSRDPITLAQVDGLAGRADVALDAAPDGVCPAVGDAGSHRVVRLVAAGADFDRVAANRRFAEGVSALFRGGGFGTLLASGGETADAILEVLGQGVLEIEGEILPGVPVSTMVVDGERRWLVTKSGGFGAVDALVSVVAAAGAEFLEGAR